MIIGRIFKKIGIECEYYIKLKKHSDYSPYKRVWNGVYNNFDKNGKLNFCGYYFNGMHEGVWKHWYSDDGTRNTIITHKYDRWSGIKINFYL